MKKILLSILIAYVVMGICSFALCDQNTNDTDKTLSPYFFVKSDDPSVDRLPLKSTSADVKIAGVISDVTVTQVYKNEGQRALEAIYIFPGSTRSAVYGMQMTIGERVIKAEIKEKEKARKEYEQAKKEGKSASLLEQHRPNVFQMNVANIMPGDEIKVELKYTELMVPSDNIYEFVYPSVVGPRYSNKNEKTASDSEKWVQNPYLHEGDKPSYDFDIKVDISTGMPIQQVVCTSHKVNVNYESSSFANILLDISEKSSGNRDYILKYQLAGGQIESGLLLYEGEQENFFLLMVQPPKKVEPGMIPLREYIFIVDVSGSMYGFPLDISKKLLKDLIGNLKPQEKFNVLLFAGRSAMMSEKESLPATQENIQKAIHVISNQQGGGGTEILPALKKALALPAAQGMSRTIVIVTDGYVSVEPEVFDLIRNNLGKANLFAFGIGSGVNRLIIEGMAHVGMGEPFVITKPEEAPAIAEKFRQYIQSPALSDIEIDYEKFDAYDVEPISVPDLFAQRPIISFGKWKGDLDGTISVKGVTGDKPYNATFDVKNFKPSDKNEALKYLWARHKIQLLGDYSYLRSDNDKIKLITDLGLKYNLLTQYTSFIAVDYVVRKDAEGKMVTVKQPLPLPAGVSDTAVGFEADLGNHVRFAGGAVKRKVYASAPTKESFELKQEVIQTKLDLTASIANMKVLFSSGLSDEFIKKLFTQKINNINLCYIEKKDNIEIEVKVDKSGKVIEANVKKGDIDPLMLACLVKEIKKWHFNELKGKQGVTVLIPLMFSSTSSYNRKNMNYRG